MTIVAPHLSPSWWTSLSVTILILNFLAPSEAQNTNVTCGPDWDWAQNSKGQNPCLVAAYLMEMCYYPTTYSVNPLANGTHYIGPTGDASTQNECVCSTPVYQLMSACGACQGRLFVGWQEWKFYCPSYGFGAGQFPKAVPVGTAVQYWAQIDPAIWGDNFNADRAKAIGDEPELTSSNSTLTSTSSFSTSSSSARPTTTVSHTGSYGSGSSNVGAIAGGVIGGVVGLGLIAAVVYIFLQRNRRMGSQSDESTRVVPDSENGKAGGKTVSLANNSLGMTAGNGSYVQQSIEIVTPMKLYDPNDPSTFPKTPGPAGASGLSHSATVNYGAHSRLPSDGSNGGYSGMPEI